MERKARHLIARGVREFSASVPDVDVPQTGQAIDILAAPVVDNHRAGSRHPHPS
jgi:hypothetical protein